MFEQLSWNWQPVCPWPLLLLWLAAGLLLVLWQWRVTGQAVRRSYRLTLQGMRCLGLLLFFLLMMQPVLIRRRPEKGAFRLAVLADRSRSMDQVDLNQKQSRLQQLEEILRSPALRDMAASAEVELWGFGEELQPMTLSAAAEKLTVLPGETCLGDAMEQAAAGSLGARPLGAMLILSDGRWNGGASPVEAAKSLARKEIPVSCVGIGAEGTPPDVRIHFLKNNPRTAEKNCRYEVAAMVDNDFDRAQELEVELLENGQRAASRKIRLEPRSGRRIAFTHRSLLAGMRSLSVRVQVPEGDLKPGNNADFLPMEIQEADQFRILYLGAAMHWEWRFLKINGDENDQLKMAAVIRTGKEQFFRWGLKEETARKMKGFPQSTADYEEFDAVLADSEVLWQMTPAAQTALAAFVEYRGGGLLVFGSSPATRKQLLPEGLMSLCPVTRTELTKSSVERFLEVPDSLVFGEAGRSLLHSPRGIPLYAGIPVMECTGVKKAARVLMQIRSGSPVMAAQSYGAGRCVFLGLRQTWQWRMREEGGLHEEFWNQMLTWLASNQTPQLEVLNQNCKVPVDVMHELRLRVAGTDFLPAPNAVVTAEITDPAGHRTELALNPALDQIGFYLASFRPAMPGEHSLHYRVRLPEDRVRETDASLLAVLSGKEVLDAQYNEELLRDIARITGGVFHGAEDFPWERPRIPLSRKLPVVETGVPLLFSWWMLGLLAAVWTGYWWMRRRIGLK